MKNHVPDYSKVLRYYCMFMLLTELLKQISLTAYYGSYQLWYLPFQLCSTPLYICLAYFLSKRHMVKAICSEYLATYGLLAGFMAFADTSGFFYEIRWLTVHSFVWHLLMIAAGILSISHLRKTSEGRSRLLFRSATAVFFSFCLTAEAFNLLLDRIDAINMFYINPHYKMSQIIFSEIYRLYGNAAAIPAYLLSIVLGAYMLHLLTAPKKQSQNSMI